MATFDDVWGRIERHAGQTFETTTGLPFTYRVPGDYLKVSRWPRDQPVTLPHQLQEGVTLHACGESERH